MTTLSFVKLLLRKSEVKMLRASALGFLLVLGLLGQAYAGSCTVAVTSVPPGAKVYINGEYVGEAPVSKKRSIDSLTCICNNKVSVEKEGYRKWEEYVDVLYGQTTNVKAELEPEAASEAPQEKSEPEGTEAEQGSAVCGPVFLLALAIFPLGVRRFLRA